MISEIGEEVELDEDIELAGIQCCLLVNIEQDINKASVGFALCQLIQFLSDASAHKLDGCETFGDNTSFLIEEVFALG